MSFDPTIGRWLSEDPSGFQAADANLYRYVGNNPVNSTDPSGLVEVKTLKNNTFKIADGRDAIIRVETDVRHKGEGGWIKLAFRSRIDGDLSIEDYHWLQFAYRYRKDGEKYLAGKYTSGGFYHKFAPDKAGTGVYHVDTRAKTSPYYDQTAENRREPDGILEIYDKPRDDKNADSTETGTILDAYFVNKKTGIVYYHVHYERVSRLKGGEWKSDWENITGDQPKKLPPALGGAPLPAGWEADDYKKLFTFPIPKFKLK